MSIVMLPRRPIFIMSPKRLELVGSPTMQASIVSPRSASFFSIFTVPLTAGPSSSPVIKRLIEPPKSRPRRARNRWQASVKAAMAPFMSAAPRPNR
jgi:hypothetical protein